MQMNYQMPTPTINQFYPGQQPYMQNPYMQRMENLQQFQQAIQQPQIQGANNFTPLGKIVDSVDIVKATDIPMDGNMYYFPQADGSVIYGKQWLANGQTRILPFKAILDDDSNNLSIEEQKLKIEPSDEFLGVFQNMLDGVIDRIDKLEKSLKPNSRTKKEVNADE